ncbi:Uncharacterized protein TCM_005907 [Theobroma cacao]|uniref:Uncharacterized protein n=1 Tax=Theobroma cacao TaxID=3641 RepID=A0A061DWG1_THECC|nr:Uncharacterized protein TCM_005907 [Theobroma cacao]
MWGWAARTVRLGGLKPVAGNAFVTVALPRGVSSCTQFPIIPSYGEKVSCQHGGDIRKSVYIEFKPAIRIRGVIR